MMDREVVAIRQILTTRLEVAANGKNVALITVLALLIKAAA
jgi:hypothetical protein